MSNRRYTRSPLALGFTTLILVAAFLAAVAPLAQGADYTALKRDAEKLYAEKSFALAREIYLKAASEPSPDSEARWVRFRLADTLWRSQAAVQTADRALHDQALAELQKMAEESSAPDMTSDTLRAEILESLGDFWWIRPDSRNWSEGWTYYQKALEAWSGSGDIPLARERYIRIIKKAAAPPWIEPYNRIAFYGNTPPLEVLENYLKIAESGSDRAHAHYLLAMTLRMNRGDVFQLLRAGDEFEAAIAAGPSAAWHDDALFQYASWAMENGGAVFPEPGTWRVEPDFIKALSLYQRLVKEFKKGQTPYYDQAAEQIKNITQPSLGVAAGNVFLPDSEIQFSLNWRNVNEIALTLYKIDLTRDPRFANAPPERGAAEWLQTIEAQAKDAVKSWKKPTEDSGDHKFGNELVKLDAKLPPGAYLLEAKAGGLSARELILVSDAALVLKLSGKRALAYFCDALTGAPLMNARVALWRRTHDGSHWIWNSDSRNTDSDGLAVFDLKERANLSEVFAGAAIGERQAFCVNTHYNPGNPQTAWRIYAITDRAAYRPEEEVQWKIIARLSDSNGWMTPSGRAIEYEITNPQGAKVADGRSQLNDFGSAWGSLKLNPAMPLGEYRIQFWDEGKKNGIGDASLFRMEEYKLPEFKVTIDLPEENGAKKAYRLGETVKASVNAEYYSGGPVAGAEINLIVYQEPFYRIWREPREFPWLYDDVSGQRMGRWGGRGQAIKNETLKTGEDGKASFSFETPRGSQQDLQFRIEVRVTDASRREITASDAVRVTRQRYYVNATADHQIYRPQDKATVHFKSLDANDQPVSVEGQIRVTRRQWIEVWQDPLGREIKGDELKEARSKHPIFPPPSPGGGGWMRLFNGYQEEEILRRALKTNVKGEADLTFTPEREGYYSIVWKSEDPGPFGWKTPINAEATILVATNSSKDLGYHQGAVEIIVDQDTVQTGRKVSVMLTVPSGDSYVLFTSEGEGLEEFRLLHLDGTAKLIELDITEKHVPNIFLGATLVSGTEISNAIKELIVPPVKSFLKLEIEGDGRQYRPRDKGTFTLTALDAEGRPVRAELALGLVDESLDYIQSDYAGDPRQFFFGTKRSHLVNASSTFDQRRYIRLVRWRDGEYRDERYTPSPQNEADRFDRFASTDALSARLDENLMFFDAKAPAQMAEMSAGNLKMMRKENGAALGVGGAVLGEARLASLAVPGAPPPEPSVTVRSDFRSTAFWQPDLLTDASGKARVEVTYPDSLTGWKLTARAATAGSQFGIGSATTKTVQPLMVRLQAPRFFVEGDSAIVSAVIQNNTDEVIIVRSSLEIASEGSQQSLTLAGGAGDAAPVQIRAHDQTRVDWKLTATHAGEAKLKVVSRAGALADAMEKSYPVYEHGIEKFIHRSIKAKGSEADLSIDIPRERKPGSTRLTVQLTPSMAVSMLDALPYLIDYPYGCTEQTMSRFLPATIVSKTLKDLGLDPSQIADRMFGGIEAASALATHPQGKRSLGELDQISKQGLERLYDFQHGDGGWGWWKEGESDHYMSAYVIWGLSLAKQAGIEIHPDAVDRGRDYLQKELIEEESNFEAQAWMLHALAENLAAEKRSISEFETKASDNLWENRERLTACGRALLTISAHHYGIPDRARTLVENLRNGVKRGVATAGGAMETAHWGEEGSYRLWYEGGIETTAFGLRAILATDPKSDLVEPVTNWLVQNRRGAQWSNTRDTAITVLALNDYLKTSGELEAEGEFTLQVNGRKVADISITRENALAAPSRFAIPDEDLRDGANALRVMRKSGAAAIYLTAQARYFSFEDPIPALGNEISVRRQYFRLSPRPTLLKGFVYDRVELKDGDEVVSGDRIETALTLEARNDEEYLILEDLKPAGLEAVQVRSGEPLYAKELRSDAISKSDSDGARAKAASPASSRFTGRSRWIHHELRDRKVALFADKLPEGVWEIRYEMRAEAPGRFHALPPLGHAMYVPEIRCNGAEIRIGVNDKKSD